jgi:flagellar hook-associated protein 1 FlgK
MSSILNTFNIARGALMAQSNVLNTTAHNIANASTPGYSRQETQLVSLSLSSDSINGSVGAGVEATTVTRARSALYDIVYRQQNQNLNFNEKTEDLLSQVEAYFGEPSDTGLSSYIDKFFNSWQELANSPQSQAARQSLTSVSEQLAERITGIYNSVVSTISDVDAEIAKIPAEINNITGQIASLNTSIKLLTTQGSAPNDLIDKRDLLLDELSVYGEVRTVDKGIGMVDVYLDSTSVVQDATSVKLSTKTEASSAVGANRTVIYTPNGNEFTPKNGKLGALVTFRDQYSQEIIDGLNTFTETLVTSVNAEHSAGYGLDGITGRNFFDPEKTSAGTISLSTDIDNPEAIAASGDGTAGDNSVAFKINDIREKNTINGIYSLTDYYNGIVTDLGVKVNGATSERQNQEILIKQIDNSRENVKGVNLDEELVKMIEAQRLYQSASKMINIMDSLLEEVVNLLS